MREDLAGVLQERGQQLVFDRREMNFHALHEHAAGGEVDLQVALLEDRRVAAGACGVADGDADAGQQLGRAEGLGEIVVGAVIEGGDFLRFLIAGGDDDDRRGEPRAKLLENFLAVDVGEAEVEDHEVGRALLGEQQPLLAGVGLGKSIAGFGQRVGEKLPDRRFVFDDEHQGFGGRGDH